MHARIEHLLSLRDGQPVTAEVLAHVRSCPICSSELQRLTALRAEMQALPQFDAPELAWDRIKKAAPPERRQSMSPRQVGIAAAVAAAVTLAVTSFITHRSDVNDEREMQAAMPTETTAPVVQRTPEHLDELVAQSQQLEQVLQTLPQRPRVERVSTSATIDTIEQRIQWLDFQLSNAPDSDLSEEQSRQLWRERVELMDSLVKVRYAEAGSLWF